MSQEAIFEKFQKIVSEQLGVDEAEVRPEVRFTDDLGADALDIAKLVEALEDELDVELDVASVGGRTVKQAVDFIKKRMGT